MTLIYASVILNVFPIAGPRGIKVLVVSKSQVFFNEAFRQFLIASLTLYYYL